MGRWAQHRRRGGQRPGESTAVVAPTISIDDVQDLPGDEVRLFTSADISPQFFVGNELEIFVGGVWVAGNTAVQELPDQWLWDSPGWLLVGGGEPWRMLTGPSNLILPASGFVS